MPSRVTEFDKRVSANLARLREAAKLTQPQVAAYLGVPYQSYQRMERGKVPFRAVTLDRFSELYNVSVDNICSHASTADPVLASIQIRAAMLNDECRDRLADMAMNMLQQEGRR